MERVMNKSFQALVIALIILLVMASSVPAAGPAQKNLILATTTSTQDTGLLDVLNPLFEKKTGYFVKTISVGSGQALAMGQKGEADVLLVHSPKLKSNLWRTGTASIACSSCTTTTSCSVPLPIRRGSRVPIPRRRLSKRSQRPAPSSCRGATTPGPTPRRRGSGKPRASIPWGRSGTRRRVSGWGRPSTWPKVNTAGAKAFSDFIVSAETQGIIKTYGVEKYGSPLFFPDAGKKEDALGK